MTIIAPTSQQRKTRLSKPSGRPLAKGLLASTDEAGQPPSSVNIMAPDPCAELLSPIPPALALTPYLPCQGSSRLVAMRETYRSGWVAPSQVGRLSLCPRYRTAHAYMWVKFVRMCVHGVCKSVCEHCPDQGVPTCSCTPVGGCAPGHLFGCLCLCTYCTCVPVSISA